MINILSYVFYNLSNLIFIFLIPNNFTKLFFLNYSIASGIFTFLVFYHFSKKRLLSEKIIIISVSFIILLSQLLNSEILVIWIFTFFMIYGDYFFSQRKNHILNFLMKLLLMLSSFFLYKNFLDPFSVLMIKILIIYIIFLYYYIFTKNNVFVELKIRSPIVYNFFTCLIYFSSLFILTILIPNDLIKIIYISFQVIIGIQLKLFDLKIRDIKFEYLNIDLIFGLLSFLYLVILCIYSKIYFLMIIYIFIYLSLNFLKRKYIS